MNFFFFIYDYFFLKKTIVTKFEYIFAKILRPTLTKFLRSKRFANTTRRFLDKRDFRKLEKICEKIYTYLDKLTN